MKDAPARAIQELDGRRDLATTQKYMHVSPSAVANEIRVLDETVRLATVCQRLKPHS